MSNEQITTKFKPAPGYILAKPMTREELHNSSLALPQSAKDGNDSVGVAKVIECGAVRTIDDNKEWLGEDLAVGDLIAYMPYTDVIIMEGFDKLSIVPYKQIVATRKGE